MDTIEFEVYDKYTLVARIVIDEDRMVEVTYYDVNVLNNPLPNPNPTVKDVADYLESRCFPETRDRAHEILRNMNLKSYFPLNIVKITHGLLHEDYIWLKFKGEDITYDDIKIRE